MAQYTDEQLGIALEDVRNLRRMHAQQAKRLADAHARQDGPAAARAMAEMAQAHYGCSDLFDVVEYLLTERRRQQS